MLESALAMLLHHAPAQYPVRAARQWLPPSIPPSIRSPVGPTEYPARAARQWIPLSIPPERLAEYPARADRQWIPPSIPPEQPASGSRRVSRWVSLAGGSCRVSGQYRAAAARQYSPVAPASIPPEQLASLVLLNVQKGRWEFGVEVSRMRRNLL